MVLDRARPARKGATACLREGASWLDSAGVEGEELEAELMAGSAGLGTVGGDGEVRRPAAHGSSD